MHVFDGKRILLRTYASICCADALIWPLSSEILHECTILLHNCTWECIYAMISCVDACYAGTPSVFVHMRMILLHMCNFLCFRGICAKKSCSVQGFDESNPYITGMRACFGCLFRWCSPMPLNPGSRWDVFGFRLYAGIFIPVRLISKIICFHPSCQSFNDTG